MPMDLRQRMEEARLFMRLQGRRPRRRKPQPVNVPLSVQAEYYSAIAKYLRVAEELVRRDVPQAVEALVAERQDALRADGPEDFSRTIDNLRLEFGRIVGRDMLRTIAQGAAASVLTANRQAAARQLKAIIGLDVLSGDPPLEMVLQIFATENVALIKSIPDRYFDEVEQLVFRNWRAGVRSTEIIGEISQRFGVSQARARLIARDQTNKLNGQITEARQRDLGIGKYRWRNSDDERVRGNPSGRYPNASPSHWDREGRVYSWDDPPEGGHPGEAIQCRCWAEPIVPGVNDD